MEKGVATEIVALGAPTLLTVDGKQFSRDQLHLVAHDPRPEAISAFTLTAIKDYLESDVDSKVLDEIPVILHVESPTVVSVRGPADGPYLKRSKMLTVKPPDRKQFSFGQYMEADQFVICLQTMFEPTPDRDYLLKLCSRIVAGKEITREDDGVTQVVTVKKGVALKESVDIRPRVDLAPFRSFNELPQPISSFLFRVKGGDEEDPPECALFEADGGAWQIKAIVAIKAWLNAAMPEKTVVA
jgi:hypothetical protein